MNEVQSAMERRVGPKHSERCKLECTRDVIYLGTELLNAPR